MARAVCCDRCGEFAKVDDSQGRPLPDWRIVDGTNEPMGAFGLEPRHRLLCPMCGHAFDKFMRGDAE